MKWNSLKWRVIRVYKIFCSLPNFSCNQDLQVDLDLGELDLTSQDEFILDEVDGKKKNELYSNNIFNKSVSLSL